MIRFPKFKGQLLYIIVLYIWRGTLLQELVNLTESPMCPLFQDEEEDLEHILLDCTAINCHRNTLQSLLPQTSVETLQYILSTPVLWTIAELTYSLHRGNHQLALQEA